MNNRVTLPYPPSANRYWRHNRGIIHRSTEAKQFIGVASMLARSAGMQPSNGLVNVVLNVYRPAKRGDLDNSIKVILDSLRGVAYVDDSQIVDIHARRFEDKANPRVEVVVSAAA